MIILYRVRDTDQNGLNRFLLINKSVLFRIISLNPCPMKLNFEVQIR